MTEPKNVFVGMSAGKGTGGKMKGPENVGEIMESLEEGINALKRWNESPMWHAAPLNEELKMARLSMETAVLWLEKWANSP